MQRDASIACAMRLRLCVIAFSSSCWTVLLRLTCSRSTALVAADAVLIPMQGEYFALEGISELLDTIERIRAGAES